MKLVVASKSPIKIEAARLAFACVQGLEVIGIDVSSSVAEQPFGEETIEGARNRLQAAEERIPDAEAYLAVENGLFEEEGHTDALIDRAVIAFKKAGGEVLISHSEGVPFPIQYVEEARERGFQTVTVGQVMQEHGVIKNHKDPHMTLSGTPRAVYLREALMPYNNLLRTAECA